MSTFRERLGCWLHERWRAELVLRAPAFARAFGMTWLDLRNRSERLRRDPVSGGRVCAWEYSSSLTLARVFPEVAERLLRHCVEQWPISFGSRATVAAPEAPEMSIIVGVRGTGRLEQFRACLDALLGQVGVDVEIIVVEQSWKREFEDLVPAGVEYLHQQCTSADMPFNRAWALNGGARVARGRILLLHDADMLLPRDAARAIAERMRGDVVAIRLPRLLFYLDQASSLAMQRERRLPQGIGFERVIANNRTPIAVDRQTYLAIGGHDESFYGWGAEDDEFMSRLRSRRVSEGAFLPILHLWHASAAAGPARERNARMLERFSREPVATRIQELSSRAFGGQQPSVQFRVGSGE